MPLFPFRSSSVKAKGSSSDGGGGGGGGGGEGGGGGRGFFSRNRGSRRDASARPSASISDPQRRRRSSPVAAAASPSPESQAPSPVIRQSRSRDPVPRPPPTRRGRSPPKRRSTYRSSLSPPSQRGSSRDDFHDRRPESPRRRRRFSASEIPHPPPLSPPSSAAPAHLQQTPTSPTSPDLRRASASGASSPLIPHQSDYPSSPVHAGVLPRYPSSATHGTQARVTNSPRLRPAVPHRASHGSTKSGNSSSTLATHADHKKASTEGFLKGLPSTFSTYTAVKELSKHADKAREWVEWFNNVQGAPDEIRVLSSKVKIAKDTVIQIQSSLEARPDLVEDESGQNLKMQIEEVIDGTTETLKKMSKLLSGFTAAAQQDGTTLGRLEGFWQSFNYKNEGEGQIKATDAELQIQLSELTTLMSNIYARALRAPAQSPPRFFTPQIINLAQPTSPDMSQAATFQSRVPGISSSRPSLETSFPSQQARGPHDRKTRPGIPPLQHRAVMPTPVTPPVSPPNSTGREEGIKRQEMAPAPTANGNDNKSHPNHPVPYSPSRSHQAKLVKSPVPSNVNTSNTPPPPYLSVDPKKSPADILLDATWEGNIDAVADALRNASPNACDARNLTPLHLAAERDHMAVAMLLLDSGANVHARADGGCMPLHLAARYASADTVEMLIDRADADLNARTSDGRTPLHYAARSAEDGDEERREVLRTLRDLGADPTLATRKGETPRDVAQKRDYWDAAATLRRAEKKWTEEHPPPTTTTTTTATREYAPQNWLQRHGFMKQ